MCTHTQFSLPLLTDVWKFDKVRDGVVFVFFTMHPSALEAESCFYYSVDFSHLYAVAY